MIEKAISLHQKGQLAEAERQYRKILTQNPKNADALHLLGLIEADRKNFAVAVDMIDRAIEIQPNNAVFFSNRGNTLQEMKRLDEALVSYELALAIKPDYAEALNNLGNTLQQLKRLDEALASYDRALAIKPDYVDANYNRGNTLKKLKRLDEALASYDRALAIKPDYADAHYNRGNTLQEMKRLDEALASYERALVTKPDYAEALNNRGNSLQELKRLEEAIASYDRALAIKPDYAAAFNNRGAGLQDLKRFDEALASYDCALAIKSDYADAHYNRGNTLKELRRLDEALASYDRALAIKPDYAEAFNNRGAALQGLKRLDEALASYDSALLIKPDYAEAHYNRGIARLLSGDFRGGWADNEWRWQTKNFSSRRPRLDASVWQGENIAGRSILVFAEQGIGDLIQFARFLPLLARRGAKVTFSAPAKLIRLLRPLGNQIELVGSLKAGETYDFQCALMSLPLWFGTDLNSIPDKVPYLKPESDLAANLDRRIGNHGFKIGIAWQGNPVGKIDQGRSFPLSELVPLARIPGLRLISLQKYHGLDQLACLPSDVTVESLGNDFDGGQDAFIDTAAVMSHLDLIITSDTSIAHLAGALGCRTWVALQYVPDWRWLLDRGDSPWYPTLRLFRQEANSDWKGVFSRMEKELRSLVCGSNATPATLLTS